MLALPFGCPAFRSHLMGRAAESSVATRASFIFYGDVFVLSLLVWLFIIVFLVFWFVFEKVVISGD